VKFYFIVPEKRFENFKCDLAELLLPYLFKNVGIYVLYIFGKDEITIEVLKGNVPDRELEENNLGYGSLSIEPPEFVKKEAIISWGEMNFSIDVSNVTVVDDGPNGSNNNYFGNISFPSSSPVSSVSSSSCSSVYRWKYVGKSYEDVFYF
jgi:hypothetical protein